MANSNVDITNKIFAYVKHGKDINQPIKDVYKNSLIFIGDESQLYVPAIDTYVGIGETRFNDVLNNTIWERGEGEVSAQVRFTGSRALGSYSVAEGKETLSMAFGSHTEGYKTITGGEYTHNTSDTTEGINVPGSFAHAEGIATIASGDIGAHAEGNKTLASGSASHAEGNNTIAAGDYSHAEGFGFKNYGYIAPINSIELIGQDNSNIFNISWDTDMYDYDDDTLLARIFNKYDSFIFHNEKYIIVSYDIPNRQITLDRNIVLGRDLTYGDNILFITGAFGEGSHVEGECTITKNTASHAEGGLTAATGHYSHAEGYDTLANGFISHAEGSGTYAMGDYSHAEGSSSESVSWSSHAEGASTYAYGEGSHAEGHYTKTYGNYSHAEGDYTYASGRASHVEGYKTVTGGSYSSNTLIAASSGEFSQSGAFAHAEGDATIATGHAAHAEGIKTFASGSYSHAEGGFTEATQTYTHAEGWRTTAQSAYAHAEGRQTTASQLQAHAEGNATTASGQSAHAEGYNSEASGNNSHAEGESTASARSAHSECTATASGQNSHAEGTASHASAKSSHAEGESTTASAIRSHAEGYQSKASGQASHAEGNNSNATKDNSHSEGQNTYANGANSHAEGVGTYAQASQSHAEGNQTVAAANRSHAEGYRTYAAGNPSHAEGSTTYAIGMGAHSEGWLTYAYGNDSHSEGALSYAIGNKSHTEGEWTYTYNSYEHAQGLYNLSHLEDEEDFGNSMNSIHTIGIGTGNDDRKNAVTVMQNGDMYIYGIGDYDGTNPELADTLQYTIYNSGVWERGTGNLSVQTRGTGVTAFGAYSVAEGKGGSFMSTLSEYTGDVNDIIEENFNEDDVEPNGPSHAPGGPHHATTLNPTNYYYLTNIDTRGIDIRQFIGARIPFTNAIIKGVKSANNKLVVKIVSYSEPVDANGVAMYTFIGGYANGLATHSEGFYSIAYGDISHAEGVNTLSYGVGSHSEGSNTLAFGRNSHAEGKENISYGYNSHTEGDFTYAYGISSHAEGTSTYAVGNSSHAEGIETISYGVSSHTEGVYSYAYGEGSHAEGTSTFTIGDYSHAEGRETTTYGDYSHAEGVGTYAGDEGSHAEGFNTYALGTYSHTEGRHTYAVKRYSHAEGFITYAYGISSHAEGWDTYTYGDCGHSEGMHTIALGNNSHAEGYKVISYGYNSHAEGTSTYAYGLSSHTEGSFTYTGLNPDTTFLNIVTTNFSGANNMALGLDGEFGSYSHAEGFLTFAYGQSSHSEGVMTRTTGAASHVEGWLTEASNRGAHAEGSWTSAYGSSSHAEGDETTAFGDNSHAEGLNSYTHADNSHTEGVGTHTLGVASHTEGLSTYTYNASEHAQGQYNKAHKASNNFGDSYNTIHTIGIGTDDDNRKNAVTVMQNGDMYLYGVADYDGTNPESSKPLQQYFEDTEFVISSALNELHDNINSHELSIPQLPEQGDERFAYLLTGVSTEDGVSLSHTISYQVTGIPTKKYIDELIEANDALRYCGTVTVSADENGAFTLTHNPSAAPGHGTVTPDTTRGAVYKVTNIGFFGTQRVSPGDMIISYTDTTTASSFEGWDVINENIDLRQLKRSAVNGKAVITNVELTADGTFSYTYNNLAVSNSGTLSMTGFAMAQGGPDSAHVNISGFSDLGNVLDVDDAGGEPAQVISRGVRVLTNVSLSQTNLTTKLTYSYSYIYADTSHHRTRTGFNNGDIALGLDGVNVITGAYLTHKGTFAYSYSRIYVANSEHANEADTLTGIDAVELNSYTHSVGNIYIDPTTNHVTYSYINLSGNTGSYISDIILAKDDRLHKVITGINQRGDGKISYTYSYIETESIWERGTGEFSAQLKGTSSSATGKYSVAEGNNTKAVGNYSHAEGDTTKADGIASHAEGAGTIAYGDYSHAEGVCTYASGRRSHSEGLFTYAVGLSSHAEGEYTYALDLGAHAEGEYTYAYNFVSHAEGFATEAIGWGSHAEGGMPEDMSLESVEGAHTTAFGISSHAEGLYTMAYGNYSHAEGWGSYTIGNYSHAEGRSTYTYNDAEHAEGSFNKSTPGVTLHSIGIGTDGDNRKNAFEITNTGAAYLFGVGNYNGDNINSAKSLQQYFQDTEYVISSAINDLNDRVNTNEDVMYNSLFSKFEIVNNTISAKIGNVEKSVSVTYTPYSYALSSYTYFWGQPFNGTTNVEGNMINIGYAYTSGNIVITKAAYHKEFNGIVVETNSGRDICFGVGVGGNNRGIYDIDQEGWMIYNSTDANNVAYTFLPNYNIRIGATDAPRVKLDVKGDIAAKALYLGNRVDSNIGSVDPGTMSFYLANGSYTLTFTSNGTPPGSTACLRPGWDNQNVEFALGQEARPWKIAYISYLYSTITNDYPIRVSSNKMNPNLNADLLDGKHLNQVFDSFVFDTTSKKLKATVGGVEKEVTISGADTLNTARNFRVSDNTAAHQGAQVLFDGSADVELKLPSYITVNISGSASTSYEVKTVRNASNATYYLTFVDSDNNVALSGTSPSEKLYTTPNISINPNSGAVTGTGLGTFNRIKIANESAVKHIEFSRGGVNYITAPASGSIAFATNGKAATATGTDVIIGDALLAPGNSSVNLGNNDKRWNSLFINTANLSGQLTSTVAGGHTNHANPDSPVAPSVAGNSPFVVTSSKKNDNLNADLLDDYHANELLEKFDVTLDGDKLNIIIKVGGKEITRSIDIWGDLSNTGVLNAPRVPVTVNGTLNQQS